MSFFRSSFFASSAPSFNEVDTAKVTRAQATRMYVRPAKWSHKPVYGSVPCSGNLPYWGNLHECAGSDACLRSIGCFL